MAPAGAIEICSCNCGFLWHSSSSSHRIYAIIINTDRIKCDSILFSAVAAACLCRVRGCDHHAPTMSSTPNAHWLGLKTNCLCQPITCQRESAYHRHVKHERMMTRDVDDNGGGYAGVGGGGGGLQTSSRSSS